MDPHDPAVTEARALLLQPLLRRAASLMAPAALTTLHAELAAMRDEAAKAGTPQAQAMAEACAMALVDLTITVPPGCAGNHH